MREGGGTELPVDVDVDMLAAAAATRETKQARQRSAARRGHAAVGPKRQSRRWK